MDKAEPRTEAEMCVAVFSRMNQVQSHSAVGGWKGKQIWLAKCTRGQSGVGIYVEGPHPSHRTIPDSKLEDDPGTIYANGIEEN